MLSHDVVEDEENSDMIPKNIMKSEHNAENPKKKEGIESTHDVGELEIKNKNKKD